MKRRMFDMVAETYAHKGGTPAADHVLPGGAAATTGWKDTEHKQPKADPEGVPYGGGRADIRMAIGGDGEIYVLSKSDGMIRKMTAVVIRLPPRNNPQRGGNEIRGGSSRRDASPGNVNLLIGVPGLTANREALRHRRGFSAIIVVRLSSAITCSRHETLPRATVQPDNKEYPSYSGSILMVHEVLVFWDFLARSRGFPWHFFRSAIGLRARGDLRGGSTGRHGARGSEAR